MDHKSNSLQIYGNVVIKGNDDIYSLAFIPFGFDENRISNFNFEIVQLQFNIIIGCMIVYNYYGANKTDFLLSMIDKLLQKNHNNSFKGDYIDFGPKGYAYDSRLTYFKRERNSCYGVNI